MDGAQDSRSPSGERGLKSLQRHPIRRLHTSRSPSGERGLKFFGINSGGYPYGRSPSGERGLKYPVDGGNACAASVAPHPGSVD